MKWSTLLKRGAVYGLVTVAMLAFDVPQKIKDATGMGS
jgi:hypothetical protein